MIFGLIAIGNFGIDITPLLAGAGIVGLAIGFGAQKLVADIVSGMFFLIDDAFRAGEYLDVDGTVGTVEKISVRSMQLRHHKGAVHTIPYGEIPKITNYSRDWVIMKLKFTVPFDTDPNKVKKIFKKIGAEMMEVPEFAEDLLSAVQVTGRVRFRRCRHDYPRQVHGQARQAIRIAQRDLQPGEEGLRGERHRLRPPRGACCDPRPRTRGRSDR